MSDNPEAPAAERMHDHGPPGHELKDVDSRGIVLTAAGLALTIIVSILVVWWLFVYMNDQDRSSKPPEFPLAVQEQGLPPPPRLEGLEQMEAKKGATGSNPREESDQQKLHSYRWIDRQRGIVRIPIERAMEIIVEQNQSAAGKREPP